MFTLGFPVAFARHLALALVVFSIGLAAPSTAGAQTEPDELARRHFESGAAYFEQADYEAALREFQSSFNLSARPAILLNIATVYERLGQLDLAVRTLDNYLALKPNDDGSAVVRIRRDNLQKRLDTNASAQATPPSARTPTPPQATTNPPEPKVAAPEPQKEQAAAAAPVAQRRSEPNRVPAYVLLAIAGATGAGAVVTGIVAKTKYDDAKHKCSPSCSNAQVSSAKTMAAVSTVLTGVAVVGAAFSVFLWLNADDEEKIASSPTLGFGITEGTAEAAARWRF